MKTLNFVIGGTLLAALSTSVLAETPTTTVPLQDGIRPIVEVRVRHEGVERDAPLTDAVADTLRLRLGFEARKGPWSFLTDGEGVLSLGDDYNDANAGNGVEPFATISDPANLELNRLQIQYKTKPLTLTVGRQRIALDDQRFVTSGAWRQSEQTFDAVRAEGSVGPVKLDVVYSNAQRPIFGADAGPRASLDGDFVFLGAGMVAGPVTLKAFGYLLDYQEAIQFADASDTFGLRATGAIPLAGHAPITVAASYARQTDTALNPANYAADYLALDAGTEIAGLGVNVGYELLGADNGSSFQTPMAARHKFNGWADVFITTPDQGLQDTYVSVGREFPNVTSLPDLNAVIVYHDFSSQVGGIDYGTEWDAQIGYKPGKFAVLAKYANYRSEAFSADVQKVWLQLEWAL